MKSKTIILSKENNKGRGILTIYQEEDLLQCRIRLYNTPKLSRFCKLGIYHNSEVYSANLLNKEDVYTSSMVGNFDIDKDFYAAIIDTENNNNVILAGGTYAGFFFNDQSVFDGEFNSNLKDFQPAEVDDSLEIKHQPNTNIFAEVSKENPTTNLYTYPSKIEQEKNCCEIENEKCKNCKYKEFFYSQQSSITPQNENLNLNQGNATYENIVCENNNQEFELNQNTLNENPKSILQSLVPQFQYVFENYPEDSNLNNLIPNSKFVRISEQLNEYSIGAIYEEEQMKYICYAVLCNYNSPAPEELGKHYQWLPLDKEDPLSEGYYIVFQDATDLKIVEL